MNEIFEQFKELQPAPSPGLFDAIRLSERRSDFLAKASDGAPLVLLQDSSQPRYRPGFQLKYLRAEFHTTCLIRSGSMEADGQFAIITCDPNTPELFELFIRTVTAAVDDLSAGAGTDEIQARFQRLVDLFRNFSRPGSRELTGLWAELFVISQSKSIEAALSSWRTGSSERFDFSWAGGRLEVKATTKAIRAHEFALEQLRTPDRGRALVASLLLQPMVGGLGIMDLARSIERATGGQSELRQKPGLTLQATWGASLVTR